MGHFEPRHVKRWALFGLLLGGLLLAQIVVMVPKAALSQDAPQGASQGAPGGMDGAFEARALIQAVFEVVLSSEISGRIDRLPLREGERFAKGDTLLAFDCRTHDASLKVAKATLEIAALTRDNAQERSKLGSIGALQVGVAKAEVDKAQGEADAAAFNVDRCHIRAPFDGLVVAWMVHPHETVAVGAPLMHILDDRDLEIKIVVPSLWLSWLDVGVPFDIHVDETGETLKGRITRLGALVDAVGQSIPAYGVLDKMDANLIAGMSGTVRFHPPLNGSGQ